MVLILIISGIMLLVDALLFTGIKQVIPVSGNRVFRLVYWALPIIIIAITMLLVLTQNGNRNPGHGYFFMLIFTIILILYLPKIVGLVGVIIDWLLVGVRKLYGMASQVTLRNYGFWMTKIMGGMAALLFLLLLYGHVWGRFAYRTVETELTFKDLPAAFDGLRVLQFSDLHIGSFYYHPRQIERMVEKLNNQRPDVILFTGDWVNNFTEETLPFVEAFKKLDAPYGKYAVLGNHDYGDYHEWSSDTAYHENIKHLNDLMKEMGFTMLNNTTEFLTIGKDSLAITGVENWGLPPFPQYGNLQQARENVHEQMFSILLTHDPSHWDAEVLPETNIQLTLAGHTHGMQFGIRNNRFRWSPVALKYPKWGGSYRQGQQVLHVSTGIGNIGYLGRVGMWPVVEVLTLRK